ncbi:SdiA-regulated domain-containing protein [Halopseudomonas pachastrellae]|nr:SdiA-regulated domain-containing protein [Halopseudomonas pachastrellae]
MLNGEPLLVELSVEGRLLRKVRINGVHDMEGLTYVAGNRFVIAERSQRLIEN